MAPPGWSTIPFTTDSWSWKGALPPSAVSRLMAVRLAKEPAPARIDILGEKAYATPNLGWITFQWVGERPSGKP